MTEAWSSSTLPAMAHSLPTPAKPSRTRRCSALLARPDGRGGGALAAFGALTAADLLATARHRRGPFRAAKPLLMPALAVHVLRRRQSRTEPLPTALLAGLACATVGDTALLYDERRPAFLAGITAFLGTQVSYAAGMARAGGARGLRARPGIALGCALGWLAVNGALRGGLPAQLRPAVAVYSGAIAAMAALGLGVGGRTAVGASAFLGSDLLIGLQTAGREFPGQEVLVMAGYCLGQYLIATGRRPGIPS